MSAYVFHCTPCGSPHAGECPPKLKAEVYIPKDLPESAKKLFVPSKVLFVPNIGSEWEMEDWDFSFNVWIPRSNSVPGLYYKVLSVDLVNEIVTVATYGSGLLSPWNQNVEMDHFNKTGHDYKSSKVRFVPKP